MRAASRKRPGAFARAVSGVLLAGFCGLLALLYLRDPSESRVVPPCPTFGVAGVCCPGCGSLRSVHHALHGRWREALRFNPVMVGVGLPVLGWYMAGLAMVAGGGEGWRVRGPRWLGWAALAGLVVWGVARNLPGAEGLRPPVRLSGAGGP